MTLHDQLVTIFRNVFNDETLELRDETVLESLPDWDSVTHINLMFSLESAFGVQFAGNDLTQFRHVGPLRRYLEERIAPAA